MILSSADRGLRNPMTGTAACCARATTGDAAALPSPAMNSLRSISDLLRLDRQPIAVRAACLALPQSFLQRGRPLVPLGITTKSVFIFTRPGPLADQRMHRGMSATDESGRCGNRVAYGL